MIEVGKNAHKYFDRDSSTVEKRYEFKSIEAYSREQGKSEQPSKRYFSAKTLPDLINSYPILRKTQMSQKEIDKEKQNRLAFIDFLQGLLNLNPIERWSPQQAKRHPFITGEKFTHPFQPPFIPRKPHSIIPPPQEDSQQKAQPLPSPSMITNGFRNNIPTQTYSDSYLSPTYSSLPNHFENNSNRSSYVPPLPSVLEPPHIYQHDNLVDQNTYHHLHPQQIHLHPQQSQRNGNIGMGRPRASTLGTMQVPPQIQWATVDHADGTMVAEGSLYSPYYPYGQPQQSYHPRFENENNGLLPMWNSRQTIDLERDGDWQEDTKSSIPHRQQQQQQHRRSNSSVRYSDAASSIGQRSSLHRFVRGNAIPYSRQDLEWDGVVHHPPPEQQDDHHSDHNNKNWMIA